MILQAVNLVKEYKSRKVVDTVSLEVKENEIVGLLGPNGAGKTTTFHILVGLINAKKGKVYLDDKEITKLPMYLRARKGIGYLPQETSVFRGLTVEENILAILETLPVTKKQREEKLEFLLEELGIKHLRHQNAYSLSGGERRRCEIARTLVSNPHFLLLDEPFVGIDPITVAEIQSIIAHLKNKGLGILVTDHNVRETLEIIDRAYIMYEGKILLQGTAKELLSSEEVRKVYLGEKFRL